MQHQYWITKQTLSRKLGRKEDDCIISSDAELDAKLELFRNIQVSCALIQRIIDKYQETICYLSQEKNAMGRFLKENSEKDKTQAGEIMQNVGKSLIFCAQQQLILHEPLMRFYQELETFRQQAIGDTLQNVLAMEKARTEYRAALSWMKNVSQQLDPDTSKQLEKFKKVQDQVRRGKTNFDKLSYDCLQKVDLLAAARCNMLNHALSFYQKKYIHYTEKSAKTYSSVTKAFNNHHRDQIPDKKSTVSRQYSNNNMKKNPSDGKSLINESGTPNTENTSTTSLDANYFEQLTNEDSPDINKSINSDKNDTFHLKNSDLLLQYEAEQNYNELEKILMNFSEYDRILNVSSMNKTKSTDISMINSNKFEEETFLPSALLKQSLNIVTNPSKTDNFSKKKDNVEPSNKQQSTKSWLNLFEELDPLTHNPSEKSTNI